MYVICSYGNPKIWLYIWHENKEFFNAEYLMLPMFRTVVDVT